MEREIVEELREKGEEGGRIGILFLEERKNREQPCVDEILVGDKVVKGPESIKREIKTFWEGRSRVSCRPRDSCRTLKDRCSGHGPHSGHSQIGDVPLLWRKGNVVPIFKKGDRGLQSNYDRKSNISGGFCLDQDQGSYGLPAADVCGMVLGDQCPVEGDFPCQPWKYRTFNGYSNNVQNPRTSPGLGVNEEALAPRWRPQIELSLSITIQVL
ncbi:hypothetical protein GWK47_038834 [Chionoecetes opilio]|uniref:Uncharacterized protein n=1 Tax=Chionoecetes opilio TaxID=41210 RepID=A0A8J4YEX7_CHIOP|nr:hypothetical protein GWK47_038834 [Chionoecetes opilio]